MVKAYAGRTNNRKILANSLLSNCEEIQKILAAIIKSTKVKE